jgi:CubicO group peptidase (beta-lactamase class C family)
MKPSRWLGFFVLVCAVRAFAADLSFEEEVTRRLRRFTEGESPGVSVLVARDGRIVFQGGFGLADLEQKTPITPDTKFRIGSITKQFTAAAVLRLAESGKLTLDDSLAKFFPEFPGGADVTVHHLLTHTSGLHSYTSKPDFLEGVTKPIEPRKLIASFQNDPPDFRPGADFRYNNSAYFLLGEIVAQVSGQSFADYLRDTFFEPLGMKDTGIYVNATPPPGMARGYSHAGGKLEPALDWDMSWAGGAGALYSTAGDLFRWNEALFGGRVVQEVLFKAATTPVQLPPGVEGMKYGYGLATLEIKRLPAIGHGGGLHGWASDLVRLPDQRCTVVVLANTLPAARGLAPGQISRDLVEKLLADEINALPPMAEDTSIDPKTFPAYVGRFDYPNGLMSVTVDGDALYTQITDQPRFRLFPKGRDEFFLKAVDVQLVFLRDDNGQVVAVRHLQGGNSFKASKQRAAAVTLTAEQLDAFIGRYRYGPDTILTVSREGTQLLAELTGQPKLAIYPTSETEFEWRIVKATVQFVKGADGAVEKIIHTQNGRSFDAPVIK